MSPIRFSRKAHSLINILGIIALLTAFFAFPAPAEASTYVVNTTDSEDDGMCDAEHCSLREAIRAANVHVGPDTIWFNIEWGSPPWIILIDDELPSITDDNTIIDASTMPTHDGGPSVVIVGNEDTNYAFLLESTGNLIRGFEFVGFQGEFGGAGVVAHVGGNTIEWNVFGSSRYGIILESSDNIVRDNFIGVKSWGSPAPNDEAGIIMSQDGNLVENNHIAFNGGAGILLDGLSPEGNTFTHNSIHDNGGLGIDIGDGNGGIDAPLLSDVGLDEISGEACRDCTVELFLAEPDPTDYGEGRTFLGEVEVEDDRTFTFSLEEPLTECDPVTATATDSDGSTSEFSWNGRAGLCMTFAMPPIVEPYLTVNTEDDDDDGVCNEDHCSLREAINYANSHLGRDTISFDIPGAGPHEILIAGEPLPILTDDHTAIDGTSEPDYDGSPVVWIVNERSWRGLYVSSQRNTIRGLGITGFVGDTDGGLLLEGGFNRVEDNVIVGNGTGISVHSNYNTIIGNSIGVNAAGDTAMPNYSGMYINGDDNQIGLPGDGNIISGNEFTGLHFDDSEGNVLMGNIIGANASGTAAIPNGRNGIYTEGALEIGGLGPSEGNIIYGNGGNGIQLYDTARDTVIAGNIIADNGEYGIVVDSIGHDGFTFTRNSIFNNGDLGIETNRADDHVAEFDSASTSEVTGHVGCRGCLVELFLAAPDPTGYGEGQIFLGDVLTDVAGLFTFELSGISRCDEITATVTDSYGETSEFSENILVDCLRAPGRMMGVVGFGGILILTIVAVIIRELGPETPPWFVPGVFGAGALLVAVLFLFAGILPGVMLDFGPPSTAPPDPLPQCGEYIDPDGYEPTGGVLVSLDDDPVLTWTPGPDVPEGAEWSVELRSTDRRLYTLTTTSTSVRLSDFPVEPRAGGRMEWRVRLLTEGEAACRPDDTQALQFENPMLEAMAMLPEVDEEPEEDEEVEETCTPLVTAETDVNCRYGPGSVYIAVDFLLEGETAEAIGRSSDSSWWVVRLADTQQTCWVWDGAVEAECTDELPVVAAPPTPTPPPPEEDTTPPPTPSPVSPTGGITLGCSSTALLNWSTVSDPSGIADYDVEIQRSPDQASWSAAPGSPVSTTGDKTTISVECGWYYRWRVRATDGEGNVGSWSGWATFTVTLE